MKGGASGGVMAADLPGNVIPTGPPGGSGGRAVAPCPGSAPSATIPSFKAIVDLTCLFKHSLSLSSDMLGTTALPEIILTTGWGGPHNSVWSGVGRGEPLK